MIKEGQLYDLQALPSRYLIYDDKVVMLKDCSQVRQLEAVLDYFENNVDR